MLSKKLRKRRYDLDWLRIVLIMLVFLHHVCMPFNGDDWHIMNGEKSKFLDDLMVFFEQWRLPLLFLISGAGTILATSKRNSLQFFKERSKRLLLPLVFGVIFIVPPQIYFQYISKFNSYTDLYPLVFTKMEVNHLWFIEQLFVFSVLSIPLILFLRSEKSSYFMQLIERMTHNPYGFFLISLPIAVSLIYFSEFAGEQREDFLSLLKYLFYFIVGMIITSSDQLWENIKRYRKYNFIIFCLSFILFYIYYFIPSEMVSFISIKNRWNLWYVVCHFVGWSASISILGYAQVYFSKTHKWLKLLNESIYPFYILHQTVIVILAYEIVQWEASILSKLLFLLVTSLTAILIIYRWFIYPYNFVRTLFGMKNKASSN